MLEKEGERDSEAAAVAEALGRGLCDSEAAGELDGMLGSGLLEGAPTVAVARDAEGV